VVGGVGGGVIVVGVERCDVGAGGVLLVGRVLCVGRVGVVVWCVLGAFGWLCDAWRGIISGCWVVGVSVWLGVVCGVHLKLLHFGIPT